MLNTEKYDGTIPAYKVHRNKPINYNLEDSQLFEHEFSRDFPAVEPKDFYNITIYPNLRLLQNNKPVNLPKLNHHTNNSLKQRISDLRKKTIKIKHGIWVIDLWSNNYFHWFCDVLPKIYFADKNMQETILILPKYFAQMTFVKQSLDIFPQLKIIWQTNYQKIKAEKLTHIPYLAPTGNYNESVMRVLNITLREKLNLTKFTASNKTFISRQQASSRKVINWDLIRPILVEKQIQFINFEELDWKQQIKIASHSDTLIGVHGAGLVNMLFMKPKSTIIELRRKDDKYNNCYFALASALNHKYYYLFCDVDDENELTQKNNFMIEPTKFLEILNIVKR